MSGNARAVLRLFKRNLHKQRKYPIDPEHVKEVPVSQYILTEHKRNRVYVWGNVKTGALGVPYISKDNVEIEYLRTPKRFNFAEKNEIISACCGFGFTIYVCETEEGHKLYGTGLNTDSQIGCHEIRSDHPLELLFFPREIHLPVLDAAKLVVKKVSAGRAHVAILTNEGLFTLGNNSYGQCGRSVIQDEDYIRSKYIHKIDKVDGKEIVDVECGQDHTMVLTVNGKVYSCGWSADGQTGLGHYNSQDSLTEVKGDIENERITKLACRSDFVLALNDKKEVFGWGNVEYSQMTLPDESQQLSNPTYVKMLEGCGKINDIATSGSSCLVLNENGHVFTWGFGILGTGPNLQQSKVPIQIPPQLFGFNDFNTNSKVESITCGLSHSMAVTNAGELYSWGRNRAFCLGLKHGIDQYFPFKVAIAAVVNKVYCGLDHTIAVCKSFMSK